MVRIHKGSFTDIIYNSKKGKGWFRIRDVLDEYIKLRNNKEWYASVDASTRLFLMVKAEILERKEDLNHKGHFLYKVISKANIKFCKKQTRWIKNERIPNS